MHIFFIVHCMQFPVFDFGLVHCALHLEGGVLSVIRGLHYSSGCGPGVLHVKRSTVITPHSTWSDVLLMFVNIESSI